MDTLFLVAALGLALLSSALPAQGEEPEQMPSGLEDGRAGFWRSDDEKQELIPGDDLDLDKRGGSASLITFRCSRASAVCKNGGKGPRVTKMKNGGWLCACMCPFGYENPKCEGSWWTQQEQEG